MKPTCLQIFPATCPPRAPWLTDRTPTSPLRAAAAISTCRRLSVVSTSSLKTWTVCTCLFIVLEVNILCLLTWYPLFTLTGLCQLDTGSEADMEAAIDPLLCHYQEPIGSLVCRDNLYPNEPSEVFTGWLKTAFWSVISAKTPKQNFDYLDFHLQVIPSTRVQLGLTTTAAATLKGRISCYLIILISALPPFWCSFQTLVSIRTPLISRANALRMETWSTMGDIMRTPPQATPSWVSLQFR